MRSVLRSSNASWWCAVSEPVKVAVAGGGYGSKVALPVYSELEEFQPVAVWSRRPERALELAEQAGLELGTSDLEELLRFPGLEAVRVATPVVTHPEFARAVVERGLHQLCEKPLADNLAAAREIAEAARRAGVVAAVNYGRRFEEGRRRLLERAVRCSEGRGWRRCPWCSPIMPTRLASVHVGARRDVGGGRLQGYGVHDLDLLLELFRDVEALGDRRGRVRDPASAPRRRTRRGELHGDRAARPR